MKKQKFISKIITFFQSKIRSTSGETIAETLVTMIILSLAVLMLAGAVVTSARVNKKADNTDTAFTAATTPSATKNVVITYKPKTGTETQKQIEVPTSFYETENDYQYYEAQ